MTFAATSVKAPVELHPTERTGASLRISRRHITNVLWSTTLVVLGLGVLRLAYLLLFGKEAAFGLVGLLDLDGEANLPAWYSSMLMWTSAGLLGVHAALSRGSPDRTASYWSALAAIFVYLSLDETSQIHEYAGLLLPDDFRPGGFFTLRWLIVAGPIVVATGLLFTPLLLRLPRSDALRIALAGAVFVGGAVGMEHIAGYVLANPGPHVVYAVETLIEEGMEMAGLCLFISALLRLLARKAPNLTLRLDDGAA